MKFHFAKNGVYPNGTTLNNCPDGWVYYTIDFRPLNKLAHYLRTGELIDKPHF